MLHAGQLKEVLEALPLGEAPRVEVAGDDLGFVATVTSASFGPLDEAERQKQVWAHLRQALPEADLHQIEFVFTNAPGEDLSERVAANG
jgi:acid stress-induced BolA-like protein IbaG/YrbA